MRITVGTLSAWGVGLLLAHGTTDALDAQTRTETIRGRVVGDSGRAIIGAEIRVIRAPDRTFKLTNSDHSGRYSVTFQEGTGDYLVHVSAAGWQPVRKRLTQRGGDSTLLLDLLLVSEVAIQLRSIVVRAQRTRPPRVQEFGPGTGAAEALPDGVPAALSPDQEGDLAALAATLPGGSVIGVPSNQNQITLNGLAFASDDIPREARTRTRISTSTYDPSRGGFSGSQTAVELATGGIYSLRRGHITLDAPQLQRTDRVSDGLGRRYTNVQVSAGGDGELVRDRFYYNASAQVSRRTSDVATLGVASLDVLRAAGVAGDSVTRVLALLDGYGVPTRIGGEANARTTESVSLLARLDHTPGAPRTWGATVYGQMSRAGAIGTSPTSTFASGGRTSSATGSVQGTYSFYFKRFYLNETRSGLTFARQAGDPYLRLPYGRVLVASEFDGMGALASLGFGGSSGTDYDRRAWTWETTNQTQWRGWGNTHQVKVHLQSRLDGYSRSEGNSSGVFTFSSLADLTANQPASFTRLLGTSATAGTLWSGAAAVGDQWRMRPNFQVLYGVRVEGNRFLSGAPDRNPAVEAAFGVRNDALPNTVHLSPRLGFTWLYGGADARPSMNTTSLGTQYRGPNGAIRGGIGEFRNLLPADLSGDPARSTGLPGAVQRISCIGPAVPIPDWRAYANDPFAIPAECADGDGLGGFTDLAPSVQLLSRSYTPSRSWRGNLAWNSQMGAFGLSVEGLYSLGFNQPGMFDLNFADVPRFVLAEEGGRPVFVRPSSVVSTTGFTTGSEARRISEFSRVVSHQSDLRSVSRQLTFVVTPDIANPTYFARVAYTLGSARAQYRGFDGAAFGTPVEREWAASDLDARHQLYLQLGWATRHVRLTLFGRMQSGTPFTPLVSGDVNGDGLANDRAFIFDPAVASAPEISNGMRELLGSAPHWARDCVERQLGRVSERNGCRGPWTQSLNARAELTRRLPYTRQRVDLSVNIANPLAGVDLLLHGTDGLRGWGTPAHPDPVLYRVRGFDPDAQQFRYDVNPRFGDTRVASRLLGVPFRITIDARIDLGAPLQVQQLRRVLRAPRGEPRGTRQPTDSLVNHYMRSVPDIYALTLALNDSLLLAPEQVTALTAAQASYLARMRVVWQDLAEYLVELPLSYDGTEALRRQEATIDQGWEVARLEGPTIKSILSPLQQRMLPSQVVTVINATDKIRIRYYRG